MKKLMMSLAVALVTIAGIQAQENKTIKEESTTKRVITKEGSDVKVKEVRTTDTQSGAVIVKDNNKTNQEFSEISKKNTDEKVLVNDVNTDAQNEAMIAEQKAKLQSQLEASKREQAEIAAQKKMQYEQKQAQMQKELAERRAQLESRPKGMSKLRKD
ncbi:hypothetical protein Aeqsu_2774 [Aequorivita sublithincola DSM 14238]|uniref:Uncharacterized protein n=1 Tax=Aequorivita sublithincola (strain DSM 14238 / LMG 21431 / ACAM 643 / 9-3) TaxID=746697 RepID=I3YZ06_AEQSU|nr:hypothetical protein [Aequorivita sublithincola]AFL82224.1 hypothetical protein Aeqsu_2774 [Aequorivita sublithincola DSM 14238]